MVHLLFVDPSRLGLEVSKGTNDSCNRDVTYPNTMVRLRAELVDLAFLLVGDVWQLGYREVLLEAALLRACTINSTVSIIAGFYTRLDENVRDAWEALLEKPRLEDLRLAHMVLGH